MRGYVTIFPIVHHSFFVSTNPSIYSTIISHMNSVQSFIHQSSILSIHLYLSINLFFSSINPSINPLIHLSILLFIHLSHCLSFYHDLFFQPLPLFQLSHYPNYLISSINAIISPVNSIILSINSNISSINTVISSINSVNSFINSIIPSINSIVSSFN